MKTSNRALKEVIVNQKRRENGVRAILKGKHVVTADNVLEEIVKAEEATRKKKVKNPRKWRARSISTQSEKYLNPKDNINPQNGATADCIIVHYYN